MKAFRFSLALLVLSAFFLAACGPAATTAAPTTAPTTAPEPTEAPEATEAPTSAPIPTTTAEETLAPTILAPTATPLPEERIVEMEWPPQMRLGDSDLVRLSLIPSEAGYLVTTEFPEHQTITNTVSIARPGGYALSALARLEGVGFKISPAGNQAQSLPLNETVTWRWTLSPRTAGQQRLFITLALRWTSTDENLTSVPEKTVYSKSLTIQVTSFMGLATGPVTAASLIGLTFGVSLSLPLALYALRPRRKRLQASSPNPQLVIEQPSTLNLSAVELSLLRALFRRYARVTLEAEFRSGYSGARTFLALPIRADGRADAHTIVKIGERAAIQQEFENYETFVKDTLPPITARIQEIPVTLPTAHTQAALRYTFIGEAGRTPTSLRAALLAQPDPSLLKKLFETFGPNWWMQRRPYTFRLAQEYDRMLPTHYVLKPIAEKRKPQKILDGKAAPSEAHLQMGEVVALRHFLPPEPRADGVSLSLTGVPGPGQPALRVRWLSLAAPESTLAQVIATRETLLRDFVSGFDLYGLPDPLPRLPALLDERLIATQSTIHGDLNLENILVGLGSFVWLIDFAQTRDGHPLYDFAHLQAEIIAHILASQFASPADYLTHLKSDSIPLLSTLHTIASRCLFNTSQPREYHLALCVACLGALKYPNLEPASKHLLYLTAAYLIQTL